MTNRINIYALAGYRQSGKDSFAKYLMGHYSNTYSVIDDKVYPLPTKFYIYRNAVTSPLVFTNSNNTHMEEVKYKKHNNVVRFAFADKLKELFKKEYPNLDITDDNKELVRPLLCDLADDYRIKDENYFVRPLFPFITTQLQKSNDIVITDLRFMNEYKILLELNEQENINVCFLRIIRPSIQKPCIENEGSVVFKSETEHLKMRFDYTVLNNF